MMSPAEKVEYFESDDFNSYVTKGRVTRATWDSMQVEATAHRDQRSTPRRPDIYTGDTAQRVLDDMMIGENKLFPRTYPPSSTLPAARAQRRIYAAVDRALVNESTRRYYEDGSGYLSPQDIRQITSEILGQEVMIRESALFVDWWRTDRRTIEADVIRFDVVEVGGEPRATNIVLEPAAVEAYIPIDTWRSNPSGAPRMNVQPGQSQYLTMEEYLRNLAPAGSDPSDEDLEEAYFYLNALPELDGIDYATRRLAGEAGL